MDGIHKINDKIIPIEKEMNLRMKLILMPELRVTEPPIEKIEEY